MRNLAGQFATWARRQVSLVLVRAQASRDSWQWQPRPIDPLEPVALITAMSHARLKAHGSGKILLSGENLVEWLDLDAAATAKFDGQTCFRHLLEYLATQGPVQVTNAVARVAATADTGGRILLEIELHPQAGAAKGR